MAEAEDIGSGVISVFESIASVEEGKAPNTAATGKPRSGRRDRMPPHASRKSHSRPTIPATRPKARIGRFPGRKNGSPKEQITGRITPQLKDAYVDWALTERVALGELLEKALVEYHQRHRANGQSKPTR